MQLMFQILHYIFYKLKNNWGLNQCFHTFSNSGWVVESVPHLNLEKNFTIDVCVWPGGGASFKPKTELLIFILYSHI